MKNIIKTGLQITSLLLLISMMLLMTGCGLRVDEYENNGVAYFRISVKSGYRIEEIDDRNNPLEMNRIVIPDYVNNIEVNAAGTGCYVCTPELSISSTHTERIYFPWTLGGFATMCFGPEKSDVLKYVISSSNAAHGMGRDLAGGIVEIGDNEEGKYVITNWLWEEKQRDKPSVAKKYYEYFLPANISYMFNFDDNPNKGYFFVDLLEESGKLMKPPYKPRREGYDFLGWYKDEACTEEWDFENDTVEIAYDEEGNRIYEEIKIYAGWEEQTFYEKYIRELHNIAFMLNYEDAPNEGYYYTTIKWFSGKIKEPEEPEREGFSFEGWFKDESCTEEWDFKSDRTRILLGKKIVLYAKWEERKL